MAVDSVNISNQIHLFEDMQSLLEKQIEFARKSDLSALETLAEQADSVISKIAKIKTPEKHDFNRKCQHLTKLYKQLELILAANKDNISRQLKQIAETRKALGAYRNNA